MIQDTLLFKYIIVSTGAILFNQSTTHSQVAQGFKKIYSAGTCVIMINEEGILKATCGGGSSSLNMDSIPDKDELVVLDLFSPVSKIKYFGFSVSDFYNK